MGAIQRSPNSRWKTNSNDSTRPTPSSLSSVKQNFEGAVAVEAVVSADVHGDVQDLVFNDSGTGFVSGRPASGRIFAGIDYLDGTAERELIGCIPVDYSVTYEQGGMTTYSLSMLYADEQEATSITPTGVTQVTDGSSVPFHGTTLTIDAADVTKLQSATLSISNIARFQRGGETTPVDAVIAAPETTLEASAIFTGPETRLDLAYGGGSVNEPQDQLSSVTGSFSLTSKGGASVTTYDLPKLKPDSYQWADLIDAETDLTDPTTFHVNGGVTVS
ncbi:phage tail tube protein [Haloplanus litoreus]|uniref:Phage tail tube protein n=1 Tax=Haloplanus litoreus TaxID=767515 RepID=A0ABD5ZT93_9EURY